MDKRKQDPHICHLQGTYFKLKRHTQTESEGMEKSVYANRNEKEAGVPILTSGQRVFKTKTIKKTKKSITSLCDDHTRRSIQQEYKIIIYIYVPYVDTLK